MGIVQRKYTAARSLYQSGGSKSVLDAVFYQPFVRKLLSPLRLLTPAYWRHWDNPVLGRWVELRGNTSRIEGCTFSLESPAIPTGLKALFLFDRYERAERDALRQFLDRDLPVVEFGGSVGVVACVTNRQLRDPARHVVVEANATMIRVLEENRARNECEFAIMHRAVAYGTDAVTFYQDDDFLAGSVQHGRSGYEGRARRAVHVPTVSLGEIMKTHGFARCTLICDIEGAETELVRHEHVLLGERVGTIIMETHPAVVGQDTVSEMLETLERVGFRRVASHAETVVLRHERSAA